MGNRDRRRGLLALAAAISLVLTACAADEGSQDGEIPRQGSIELTVADGERCEVFDAGHCLFPFPSDHFTRPDPASATGRRVAFDLSSMPANTSGVHIDPAEWNRSDGFSPGTPVLLYVDGIDLDATGAAPVTDIGRSIEDDSPTMIIDADTGARHPHWAELDANAPPDRAALILRPAINFREGTRYVVALRDLRRGDGSLIEPSPGFRAFRDRLATDVEAVEGRRPAMEDVFGVLDDAGVERDGLNLAWDFTVASEPNLTGRLLSMRDAAFDVLGDQAPEFVIESTEDNPDPSPTGWARVVKGSLEVPSFLTGEGGPGTVLANEGDPEGIPSQNGSIDVPFTCVLPRAGGPTPKLSVLYGHGLLGSQREAEAVGKAVGTSLGATVCGVDWIGMATVDVAAIVEMIEDMSGFRIIPDRLQQSMVNFLFAGRALVHGDGFGADPAFTVDGDGMIGDQLAFVGNSQGGILGGALSAVATDWEHAFLGVPAMNYSTLLQRSIDFDAFAPLLEEPYPDPFDYQLVLALVQMLWDRGENNGYAWHVATDPLPGAEPKRVLVFAAFGDHQVANAATDVMVRTMGLPLRAPGLADGRSPDAAPFWGIEAIDSYPHPGSGYVMWDFGTPAPPTVNLPNRQGEDPHGQGRSDPAVLEMVARFLRTGEVIDVCGPGPCQTLE
jgi:hypothetical protein